MVVACATERVLGIDGSHGKLNGETQLVLVVIGP